MDFRRAQRLSRHQRGRDFRRRTRNVDRNDDTRPFSRIGVRVRNFRKGFLFYDACLFVFIRRVTPFIFTVIFFAFIFPLSEGTLG